MKCIRQKFVQIPHPTLKKLDGTPVMVTRANTRIASGSRVKQLRKKTLWQQQQECQNVPSSAN